MFYSKARHYLFSVSVVYWISFLLRSEKNTETHSSFIAKWKYVWNNERMDTLLKVYLWDAQINSFDLRRSGWRWNGKKRKENCREQNERRKLYLPHVNVSIMYCETIHSLPQPVENFHENKAIKCILQ